MSDSQLPEPLDDSPSEPRARQIADAESGADAAPKQSGWQDIEDGVGELFAAFERGVLNIVDAEGRKRRNEEAAKANGEPVPESEPEIVEPRPGMTYDEVLTPIRWRNIGIGIVAAIVLGALYWGLSLAQVALAANDTSDASADAIVVLGAAQFDGTPSPVLAARLDHALELWNGDRADVIITTGSNQEGDRFTEGFSGFVYLRDAGVPEDAILTIVDGDDTYQQMTAAQAQLVERELDSALLVSDRYHTFRLRAIAEEIGLDAQISPTEIGVTRDDWIREATAVSIGRIAGYRRVSAWG